MSVPPCCRWPLLAALLCVLLSVASGLNAASADVISQDGRVQPLCSTNPPGAIWMHFNGWAIFNEAGKVVAKNDDKHGWDIPNYAKITANLLTPTGKAIVDEPPQCFLIAINQDVGTYPPGNYRFTAWYGFDVLAYQYMGQFTTIAVQPPYISWDGTWDPKQPTNEPVTINFHFHAGSGSAGSGSSGFSSGFRAAVPPAESVPPSESVVPAWPSQGELSTSSLGNLDEQEISAMPPGTVGLPVSGVASGRWIAVSRDRYDSYGHKLN